MSKNTVYLGTTNGNTPKIRNKHVTNVFGFSVQELEQAIDIKNQIERTHKDLMDSGESKLLFNLPVSDFAKALGAFAAAKRGRHYERFIARLEHYTVSNTDGKGDLIDGKGKHYEVKSAVPTQDGLVNFPGLRPRDEVEGYIFLIVHEDRVTRYYLDASKLGLIAMYESRNTDAKQIVFQLGGSVHADLVKHSDVKEYTDENTDLRYSPYGFLDSAGLDRNDLDYLHHVREGVRTAVKERHSASHLTLDELFLARPLMRESKFGHLVQDWINDHMECATAGIPGIGDGVTRVGTHEVKYASIGANGAFTFHGLKPSEFDDLYLALHSEGRVEFFKLTKRSAMSFVRKYGHSTKAGISRLTMGSQNSKAISFLRKHKGTDEFSNIH